MPFISGNAMIRVKPCETTGHTVVCYMLQDEDMFGGAHEAYERECRGISFAPDGSVSSRTMHKFFNVGERQETLPSNIMWANVERIMEKRDGSMITPVLVNGRIKCKTKKSFDTKEALLADEVIAATLGADRWLKNLLRGGLTPTFEITSPKYPIVVLYEKTELTLLHVRYNDNGNYLSEPEIKFLAPPFPMVENIKRNFTASGVPSNLVSWDMLKAYAETATGVEGVVIQMKNGDMFKLKTAWYTELHHSVTFTRWRDIARTVAADGADDLKAAFAMVGRSIEPILIVERDIMTKLRITQDAVDLHVANGKHLNRTPKDMALALKEHALFSLVMRAFRDQEVNYMEWYVKNHLETDWNLDVIDATMIVRA